jgi:DNA replication ATP-dependent helicase Dna2
VGYSDLEYWFPNSKSAFSRWLSWKNHLDRFNGGRNLQLRLLQEEIHDKEFRNPIEEGSLVAMTLARFFSRDWLGEEGEWDFMIIDEAGMIPSWILLPAMEQAWQVILAGDPRQLPPVVMRSGGETKDFFEQSIMKKYEVFSAKIKVLLDVQSRMCSAISGLVSKTFYDGLLQDDPKRVSLAPAFYEWIQVSDSTENNRSLRIRPQGWPILESKIIECLSWGIGLTEILVLSPFRNQRQFYLSRLNDMGWSEVACYTIHRAQGMEARAVILDLTDASSAFLNSELGRQLINVGISRARDYLGLIYERRDLENLLIAQLMDQI